MNNVGLSSRNYPVRTCVICRNKAEKPSLLSLFIMNRNIVFDIKNVVKRRKYYVCNGFECLKMIDKWLHRKLKKVSI